MTDVKSHLESLEDPAVLNKEVIAILQPGQSMWIPFGYITIILGLLSTRATANLKGKLKGKASSAPVSVREYCSCAFIPCMGAKDCEWQQADTVRSVSATLMQNQKLVPKSLATTEAYIKWTAALQSTANKDAHTEAGAPEAQSGNVIDAGS